MTSQTHSFQSAPRSIRESFASTPLRWAAMLTALCVVAILLPGWRMFSSAEHYLALHNALEFFSIAVSAMVFALGWNLRRSASGGAFLWLGVFALAVAVIDLLHLLSYEGMPSLVTPSSPEKAINFWLAARVLTALCLLGLVFVPPRPWRAATAVGAVVAALATSAGVAWIGLFHADRLPSTFVPGEGVTAFKVAVEYGIAGLHALAAVLLLRTAVRQGRAAMVWLAAAAWVLGLTGLFFTLYVSVNDVHNFLGHAYKVVASIMFYKAVFAAGVQEPNAALERERALLRTMIDSVPDLISFKDVNGAYLGCNRAFSACYNLSEQSLVGRTDAELFGAGMQIAGDAQADVVVTRLERHEEWVEGADGTMRLLDTLRIPFRGSDGNLLGEIDVSRDFTERRRIRDQIAEREKRLLMALQGASLGVWDWDIPSGRMLFSPLWASMLGRRVEDLPPDVATWEALVHPDDWGDIQGALEPHLRGETDSYTAEYRLRHAGGHWVWVMDAGRVLERDDDGKPLRAVGVHQDISERKSMEASLLHLATSDPLTGLWNRRHFTEVVNGELGRVRRHGVQAGLMLLDLDHFKRINDTRGHAAGDEVLRHFAGIVSRHLREADVFARLGGEEFAVLLPCIDDAAGAVRAAERVRELIASTPAIVDGVPLPFSVSIGVAMLEAGDGGFDAVFSRADEALYEAKGGGRNRTVLSAPKEEAGSALESTEPA